MDDGQQRSFCVKFAGEGVDDYGGAYREVFAVACDELASLAGDGRSTVLRVLALPPVAAQGKGDGGLVLASGRESASAAPGEGLLSPPPLLLAPLELASLRFLGQFMGMALRSGISLRLPLSRVVWRLLAWEPVDASDLPPPVLQAMQELVLPSTRDLGVIWMLNFSELALIDPEAAQWLQWLLTLHAAADRLAAAEALEGITWTATLGSGAVIPLRAKGCHENVSVDCIPIFVASTLIVRALEFHAAAEAVRQGLGECVPEAVLPLMRGVDLQGCICGELDFDVRLLAAHTDYEPGDCGGEAHLDMLWEVLAGFTPVQRTAFLRFCWARNHLPLTATGFSQRFKVQAMGAPDSASGLSTEAAQKGVDALLPKSSTCFGVLQLPTYSTMQVMRERLLYAIQHCHTMDADFLTASAENANWQ
ncbi:HERC2 [Symbiodinium sp. KB8]|nr:HERC2 [Symbiodinium sp. KB8]